MSLNTDSEIDQRRSTLTTVANPDRAIDYIITLSGRLIIEGLSEPIRYRIRYVPDQVILDARSMADYAAVVRGQPWPSFEEAALALNADFHDRTVPRWVEIYCETRRPGDARVSSESVYSIILSERQPDWNNPTLLARLRRDG